MVGEPGCMLTGDKSRFKPIECNSVKKRQCIGDFSTIIGKCVRTVAEVQEMLGQEWLEFTGVGTIKLVCFSDLSLNGGFPGVVEAIGKLAKSLDKIR